MASTEMAEATELDRGASREEFHTTSGRRLTDMSEWYSAVAHKCVSGREAPGECHEQLIVLTALSSKVSLRHSDGDRLVSYFFGQRQRVEIDRDGEL
jgi:hypothetical protein